MNRKNSAIQAPGRLARMFSLLVVLAFLVSAVPQPALAAANLATCGKTYTVVAGDTLSSIAAKYNTTVQVLADLNDLKEPYVLSVGQKICLPAGATTTSSSSSSSSSKKLDFNVARSGTRLQVDVAGGPKKANYRVTVGTDRRTKTGWTRIGKIHVSDSKGTGYFGLPQNLRKETSYIMCLKNMVSNDMLCKRIKQ